MVRLHAHQESEHAIWQRASNICPTRVTNITIHLSRLRMAIRLAQFSLRQSDGIVRLKKARSMEPHALYSKKWWYVWTLHSLGEILTS
jgi:hypothetical protein